MLGNRRRICAFLVGRGRHQSGADVSSPGHRPALRSLLFPPVVIPCRYGLEVDGYDMGDSDKAIGIVSVGRA